MHWLSLAGMVLIVIGTACTYWGVEMRRRQDMAVPRGQEAAESPRMEDASLRADYGNLLAKAKLDQEENERLRSENVTLSLKQKRAEEDAEVYKYRAQELQQELSALRQSAVATEVRSPAAVPTPAPRPQVTPRPPPPPPPEAELGEAEIIERMQQLLGGREYAELEVFTQDQVKKNPEWMLPRVYLGVASRHLGKRQQALQAFVHVVENGPGDDAYPQAERALKLLTSGIQDHAERNEWDQLIEACEKSLAKEPDWLLPYYFAGLAYSHRGEKVKAIEYLTEFVEHGQDDPEWARAQRALRLLRTNILELQKQGDYPALIRACEREMETDPDWLTPYYLLGLSYARLGNVVKARENLELFTRRGADDPDYENAVRLLESLE